MTDEQATNLRARLALAGLSLLSGVVFFRFIADTSLWIAVVLAALVALTYLLGDKGRERIVRLACIGAFAGLGSWLVVGLGLWSLAATAIGPAMYLAYEEMVRRRGPHP